MVKILDEDVLTFLRLKDNIFLPLSFFRSLLAESKRIETITDENILPGTVVASILSLWKRGYLLRNVDNVKPNTTYDEGIFENNVQTKNLMTEVGISLHVKNILEY